SSFNLIGAGGAGSLVHGTNNNQVGVANAGLGALANNGGTTQTHALLPTSPAVEAGGNANLPADTFDLDGDTDTSETLPVDQRGTGFPRNADSQDANTTQTVDIGAFELHPSVEDIPNQTTAEDTPKPVTFNLGDDTGALIATVTATSSNTALVASDAAHLSFSGSGGSRTLTITPNTNANSLADGGTTTITVTVTATNGRTAVDTFDLTVTEVNDNPDAVNDTLTAIDEDSGVRVIPFADLLTNDTAGPANESGQTITVTNVSNPVGGTVAINGTNVEFTPTANYSGPASFDYTITDNGTTNGAPDPKSDTATASFTINAINDPPSFTKGADQSVNEDAGPQSVPGWATNISAGPNEVQNLTFNVSVVGTTGNLAFSSAPAIDATTGTLTYTTAANTNGTANLSVTLSDDGSNTPPNSNTSAAQTFNITVNAVNDAPTFQLGANPSVNENAGPQTINGFAFNFQPGPVTATDESGQTLVGYTVTQTGSTGGLTFSAVPAINNAGTLTFTATGGSSGTATFDVVATDSGPGTPPNVNQSAPVSFTISVNAVNDPPVNVVPGPQGTNQNTPLVFSSGNGNQISVTDTDAGANPVQVTLTATNGTISLSGISGLSFSFSDGNGTGAGDGTNDVTMTFRGTLTNINAALNGMTFTPTSGFSGAASLTITSNDLGNTGSGGPQTDTDVVNIQVSTNISIQDAQVAEPGSGSIDMVFTVSLSAPAPAGGTSVSFTTVQQMPAISHATAGVDYTTTSGTVNFAMGEQVKTIGVPVLADSQAGESNETFLVQLSNPVNGTIADGTATGTILVMNQPGTLLISELRTSGPGGAGDDFVEIYNNSDSPHTVAATDGSAGYGLFKMGAACGDTPVLIGVIPNGEVIPARGHYLFVGSAYSLSAYSAGNLTLSEDIENDRNVGFFSTSSLANISSTRRFDAVGFGLNTGSNCDLLRESTTLTPMAGSVLEYSYYRDECGKKGNPGTFGACPTGGATQDTNVNANDFIFADTTAAITPAGQRLGAPGPQNIGSPAFTSSILALLLDATKGSATPPNRFRDTTPQGPNALNGTLTVVRRFVNNTGAPVTRLRFRIVDFSTVPTTNADLRALDSVTTSIGGINDSATCLAATGSPATPCTVQVVGTTLDQPPTQAMGGGNNSSWTITLGTPLAAGASVNVQFRLGVQQTGAFKFFFNIEALP
ncbi:MAG TPA: Ig-like domain-containing protein, partial [Pyrinomonadaceae bacterium]|nr:Ig-like domain-containing protein [Pyrinomonadaceae bacterium]